MEEATQLGLTKETLKQFFLAGDSEAEEVTVHDGAS